MANAQELAVLQAAIMNLLNLPAARQLLNEPPSTLEMVPTGSALPPS
jgi:hypothetical protein